MGKTRRFDRFRDFGDEDFQIKKQSKDKLANRRRERQNRVADKSSGMEVRDNE